MLYPPQKIRIAFVLWTLEAMGGSEHVVFDIVQKLDKKKYFVLVIGFRDGPIRQIYEQSGVKVEVVSSKKKIDLNFIHELRFILQSEKIDIVNPHHFSPLLYTFLATIFYRIKIVYTEHSVWQYLELGWLKKIIVNFLLFRVDAVVAISDLLFDYYKNNFFVSKKKNHLIINGIDIDRFKKFDNTAFKKSLGFVSQDKLIGMVANLRPEKNHKVLIKAFSRLVVKHKRIHLILAGLDCMNGEVHEYADKLGLTRQIHFLGSRDDIPNILNIFDIFCLPSEHEGLPLTLLEAMACGIPVIGTDVMGINEVIKDNSNGLLFPLNNEKILSEKIEILLSKEEQRVSLIREAIKYVKKNYNLTKKMDQYNSLFQMLSYRKR